MDTETLRTVFFGSNPVKDVVDTPDQFISQVLPNVYIFAGFILFLYFVFGGFTIISSAGDSKKADEGKQALTNAIIGFVLIFVSFWIIQVIEIITGIEIL